MDIDSNSTKTFNDLLECVNSDANGSDIVLISNDNPLLKYKIEIWLLATYYMH